MCEDIRYNQYLKMNQVNELVSFVRTQCPGISGNGPGAFLARWTLLSGYWSQPDAPGTVVLAGVWWFFLVERRLSLQVAVNIIFPRYTSRWTSSLWQFCSFWGWMGWLQIHNTPPSRCRIHSQASCVGCKPTCWILIYGCRDDKLPTSGRYGSWFLYFLGSLSLPFLIQNPWRWAKWMGGLGSQSATRLNADSLWFVSRNLRIFVWDVRALSWVQKSPLKPEETIFAVDSGWFRII